jgi:hypothetical protein
MGSFPLSSHHRHPSSSGRRYCTTNNIFSARNGGSSGNGHRHHVFGRAAAYCRCQLLLQRANMPNVAAAVVDVFSIAALRVRTTAAEKYLPLHCEHDNNSKDHNDMHY